VMVVHISPSTGLTTTSLFTPCGRRTRSSNNPGPAQVLQTRVASIGRMRLRTE
jgi:hypothetical protein